MPVLTIPKPLEEKLGPPATEGLISVLNEIEKIAKEDIILIAEEKYERRLTDEMAQLRSVDLAKLDKRITDEIAQLRSVDLAKLDKRITDEMAQLRSVDLANLDKRITEEMAKVNQRITDEVAKLDNKISDVKVDLIKWQVRMFTTTVILILGLYATIIFK